MLFYRDIRSSYTKKKVKDSIDNNGGRVSDIISPDISLIVPDNAKNEKTSRPLDASRSNAVMTRSYRMLQKALERKRKEGLENKTQLLADKHDVSIYSSEKFLKLVKDGASFHNEKSGFKSAQRSLEKDTEIKHTSPGVKSKNGFRLRQITSRCKNPVRRLFNKNPKYSPNSPTPNGERKLQHNFLKVEDESGEMRPLHKLDVFQKLVFCRCKPSVFHSTHLDMIEHSQTSYPSKCKSKHKNSFKYMNLSGYCEICDCSYTCLWNHITGYMHKENVSRTSYSQIDDLFSQFPTIDEFLQNHSSMRNPNAETITMKTSVSSDSDIEALDCKDFTNVLANADCSRSKNYEMNLFNTSSDEELHCKSDSNSASGIGSIQNVGKSTIQSHENKPPSLLVADRAIQLPSISSKLLKYLSGNFLPGQIRKRPEELTIYLGKNIEDNDVRPYKVSGCVRPVDKISLTLRDLNINILCIGMLHCEAVSKFFLSLKVPCLNPIQYSTNITNSEGNQSSKETDITLNCLPYSLSRQFWKTEVSDLKPDFLINGNRLADKLFPGDIRSGSAIKEFPSIGNYPPVDYISECITPMYPDFTESKEIVSNKVKSRETDEVKISLLKDNLAPELDQVFIPKIFTDKSIKIEPNVNEKSADEEIAKEQRVVIKIENVEIEKDYEMAKPENENESILIGSAKIQREKLPKGKKNKDDDMITKIENHQATWTLIKNLDNNELNNQCKNSKSLIVRLRKVLLDENHENNNLTSILSIAPIQPKYEYLHAPDYEVTPSKPKKRLKKRCSRAKVKKSRNSFTKKMDLNTWSSSLFQVPSYCLDKLVIKRYRLPSDLKVSPSSAHLALESGKRYSFYIVNQRKTRIVMTFHRKTCPSLSLVNELETEGDFDYKKATARNTTLTLKQSDEECLSSDAGNTDFEKNYKSPNLFLLRNSACNIRRKLEFRTNCLELWNIKANHGLRMILCKI